MTSVDPTPNPTGDPAGPPAGGPSSVVADGARPEARRRRLVRLVAATLAVLVGVAGAGWLALSWLQPHPYSGTVMQAPTAAPPMDGLVFSDGSPVDLAAFDGDLVLVYFGYTSCPDVCPTTLSQVAAARRLLGDDADRVQVLLVSIDPEHDDLATLGEYVSAFDADFLAATGELADVERVATQYGIFFAAGETVGGRPTIDHTATLMGIDAAGHLRIVWPSVLEVERLAADLRELL
jgi:protein SCO1/2